KNRDEEMRMNMTYGVIEGIQQSMKKKNADSIRYYSAGKGCCGPQLGISLDKAENGDKIKVVNDINVAIDESVKEMTEDVSLDFQNGRLVLVGLPESC